MSPISASAVNPEGSGPLLPLAFGSWEHAVSHEEQLAAARQRLADLEASAFFLSVSRSLSTDEFIEVVWEPGSAEISGFFPQSSGDPIRSAFLIEDIQEELEHFDDWQDNPIAESLMSELQALLKLNKTLEDASERFQLYAAPCFSKEIKDLSESVTFCRASAIDLARSCGFERVAALMEAESLRLHAAPALVSKPSQSL